MTRKTTICAIIVCALIVAAFLYINRGTVLVHEKMFFLPDVSQQSDGLVFWCNSEMYAEHGDAWKDALLKDYYYTIDALNKKMGSEPDAYSAIDDEFWLVWKKGDKWYSLKAWYDLGYLGFSLSVDSTFPEDLAVSSAQKSNRKSPRFFPE